jgi:hypothetical protein
MVISGYLSWTVVTIRRIIVVDVALSRTVKQTYTTQCAVLFSPSWQIHQNSDWRKTNQLQFDGQRSKGESEFLTEDA